MTNPPPSRSPRTGPFVDRLFGWAAKGAALLTLAVLVPMVAITALRGKESPQDALREEGV